MVGLSVQLAGQLQRTRDDVEGLHQAAWGLQRSAKHAHSRHAQHSTEQTHVMHSTAQHSTNHLHHAEHIV